MRIALWTLNIGNYLPDVCALTYPWFQNYAHKIGADFWVIDERAFEPFSIVLQG